MVKTPHSLPTGPIIFQTATIKNDLRSRANFTMLLDSLQSYQALKKSRWSKCVHPQNGKEFDDYDLEN